MGFPMFHRIFAMPSEDSRFCPITLPAKILGLGEFNRLRQQDVTTSDVRPAPLFGDGHVAGSLNIGVASPSFSVWSGFL